MAVLVAGVVGAGCDLPRFPIARGDSAKPVAPATVVQRVGNITRYASAMQRVTGALDTRRALHPLDSTLAILVMDQRGAEMANVRVAWTLLSAGNGAELRIINARTDSLGVSRASFTPGSTALPQTVVAQVQNVGRISFAVSVPLAAITLAATERAFWSGEETHVSAELRDAQGTVLTDGPVVWGTTDSTVLAIRSGGVSRSTVLGQLPGSANIVAWVEPATVRGDLRLTVKPIVRGAFVALDGSSVPPIRLEVRSGSLTDTVAVTDGRFSKRIDLPASDVEVRVTPLGTSHHAANVRVTTPRALQDIRIALVPTRWRIEGGTYNGREVRIDAAGALRRPTGSASFWRLAPIDARAPTQVLGWPESAFPLRIAFHRARSREPITAGDSAEFWRIAAQMERDIGLRLFAPAALPGDSIASGIITAEIASDGAEGHTFVTWNDAGNASDGVLMFRRAATLRDPHVVTHELLHLLGFGHATSFQSVSRQGSAEPRLTAEDVAHAQVALRLRRLQRETGARPGLPSP